MQLLHLALLSFATTGAWAGECGLELPPFDIFDYGRWSGVFRYTLYQGTYPDAGAADCQLKYWEWDQSTTGDFNMNKTYRYFDGNSDVTDSFTGQALLEPEDGAAHWELFLSTGDFYHISMVETDYDTYAAYVECDDATERIFPVISSTTPDLNQALVDRLILQFISLGLPMDNFVRVVHDDNCQYFL